MNRLFVAYLLVVCGICTSCDKLSTIYGTNVRVIFNPLKIYELDTDKVALEPTGSPKLTDGEFFYGLHITGNTTNVELTTLEGSVKDYEGRDIGDATSAQKAYANTIYPRVRDVKKAWVVEHGANVPARFCFMYIDGIPTITANRDCFGLPAGSDLGSFFYLKQSGLIKRGDGFSVNMVETTATFREFFCQDAVVPIDMGLWSEEIVSDASQVEITITLPVRVERFWTYAMRLETWGKNIEVEYSDKVFSVTIPVRK